MTTPPGKKRPLRASPLLSLSFWLAAGYVLLLASFSIFSDSVRQQFTNLLGWFGWAVPLFGVLALYLTAAGIGLWSGKPWGIILTAPLLIGFVLLGLAISVRIFTGSIPLNWDALVLVVICIVGGLGWAGHLWGFWQQVNR